MNIWHMFSCQISLKNIGYHILHYLKHILSVNDSNLIKHKEKVDYGQEIKRKAMLYLELTIYFVL